MRELHLVEGLKNLEAALVTPVPTLMPFHGYIDATYIPPYAIVIRRGTRFAVRRVMSEFLSWFKPPIAVELPRILDRDLCLVKDLIKNHAKLDIYEKGGTIVVRFKDWDSYLSAIPAWLRAELFEE